MEGHTYPYKKGISSLNSNINALLFSDKGEYGWLNIASSTRGNMDGSTLPPLQGGIGMAQHCFLYKGEYGWLNIASSTRGNMDGSTLLPLQGGIWMAQHGFLFIWVNIASSSDGLTLLPLQMDHDRVLYSDGSTVLPPDGSMLLPLQMVNMSSSSGWSTLLPSFQSVTMFSCFCEEEEQILCTQA